MKSHAKHLLMCAPMLVVAAVLLIGGANVVSLLPLAVCALMMVFMMGGSGHGSEPDGDGGRQ